MNTKECAEKIVKELKNYDKNLVIHYYESFTTESIYLKLDYGTGASIRISNHIKNNNEFHYRYELRTDIATSYVKIEDNTFIRMIYAGDDIDILIQQIIRDRDKKKEMLGNRKYEKDMNKRKDYMLTKAKKFYKNCMEV